MKIEISHDSSISFRKQLLNQLRHLILSRQWLPGSRLPSEADLQRTLSISRGTIRQALQDAENEGLIERVAGKGTFVAQSLLTGGSRRFIGYLTCSLSNRFQSQLLNGAESAARACGYRLLFCNSGRDLRQENLLLNQLIEDDVWGILVWPVLANGASSELGRLTRRSLIPLVCMDRTFQDLACDYVASDNYYGGYLATKHLLELGHRRIVFLSSPTLKLRPVAERLRGYQAAMEEAGLESLEPWLVGTINEERGFRYLVRAYLEASGPEIDEIAQRLTGQPRPTAIFAVNDLIAMLALQAARRLNLSVPDDLSIVGFDDHAEIEAQLKVPFTTVAQDTFAIGQRAAELLIKRIEGYNGPPAQAYLPVRLIVRSSTTSPVLIR